MAQNGAAICQTQQEHIVNHIIFSDQITGWVMRLQFSPVVYQILFIDQSCINISGHYISSSMPRLLNLEINNHKTTMGLL